MTMTKLISTATIAMALGLSVTAAQAGSIGDLFKQFGAFDFGGSKFDSTEFDGNKLNWEDRDRWVQEALDKADKALERSDKEVNLFDFQNYYNVLAIQWAPAYLKDPANIGNLNAYATFTEYLSRYLGVKQDLIVAIADLNRNYAILNKVDPRQLTGPFQLEATGQTRTYTERAAGAVDAKAHEAALATSAGAVEKYTAELERAIDYGKKLESHFKKAARIE
jgi:hypothetical protein